MVISIGEMEIFYKRHLGGKPVVLLHGWGGTHKLMQPLFETLSKAGADVISLDLPGFGQSSEPPQHFTTDDYAGCVGDILEKLELNGVTIVGHSFGGRLAILLGCSPRVSALVLTGSAGVKPKFSLKKRLRVWRYKRAKRRGADLSAYGSKDYKALPPHMKEVFVRIVNRHLDGEIKNINVPTLLVWGKKDRETPLYMAKRIKNSVKDCGIVLLEGGHFAYLENSYKFCSIVKSFVMGRT